MTPLAAAQAKVDQVTGIMKDNVGKVRGRHSLQRIGFVNTNAGSMMGVSLCAKVIIEIRCKHKL